LTELAPEQPLGLCALVTILVLLLFLVGVGICIYFYKNSGKEYCEAA